MPENPYSAHGPYSTGGFHGKGRRHRGDHRPKDGGCLSAVPAVAVAAVVMMAKAMIRRDR